jgi:hypothetical protein
MKVEELKTCSCFLRLYSFLFCFLQGLVNNLDHPCVGGKERERETERETKTKKEKE